MEFRAWPKTTRLFRDIVVTEKIDGTNACVMIGHADQEYNERYLIGEFAGYTVFAQSRKRVITPKDDNAGFARWVSENVKGLVNELGPGYHYGEWWGNGVNRGYGLEKGDKRFSLFNTSQWGHFADPEQFPNIPGLGVVPVLYHGPMETDAVDDCLYALDTYGSQAVFGYMNPEGIVVYHTASRQAYKVTLDGDGGKWREAA